MKLNKTKGFVLIEVIGAIAIASIMFSYVYKIELNNIRINKELEENYRYSRILEATCLDISYNCSYSDILNLVKSDKLVFPKENMNFDLLEHKDIKELFISSNIKTKPYIILNVTEDRVLNIKAYLYYNSMGKEEILTCQIIKGDY